MLEVKNISFSRSNTSDNYLFRNLNFNLLPGQLMLLQGHNGAGKTTLLKMIAGLILPERGHIVWQNISIHKSNDYRLNISYLAHKDGLKKSLTLHENLICDLNLNGNTLSTGKMCEVLTAFNIDKYRDMPCQALSQGQRRKARLAGIILKQKKIWILDEPFTFLDKDSIETLNQYFHSHLKSAGMIVMASHQTQDLKCHQLIDLSEKVD